MKLKKNLVLIGMMGVGKSLIGNSLSKKLNLKFFLIAQMMIKQEPSCLKILMAVAKINSDYY